MKQEYSSKKYSFYELIEVFPEAKSYIKNKLNKEIKQYKNDLLYATKLRSEYQKVLSKIYKDRDFWENVVEQVWISPYIDGREKKIKQNTFYLQALRDGWQEVDTKRITDIDIQMAKQIPIENFIEFDRVGSSLCPFHKDTNKSFKLYKKTNSWWCFGENIGGDSISLYMKLNNCNFVEAVKKLINK